MSIKPRHPQAGLTLIELLAFIVIVSVGLAGILGVLNFTIKNSANPMITKQQIAIAESLLEEIESKPFTFCDPDDPAVTSANSSAGCTTAQGIGATSGESRGNAANPLDNVGDYQSLNMTGIVKPGDTSTVISGLENYTASVQISLAGTALGLTDNSAALRIDVTVGAPSQPDLTLTGYRFRYAPNSP